MTTPDGQYRRPDPSHAPQPPYAQPPYSPPQQAGYNPYGQGPATRPAVPHLGAPAEWTAPPARRKRPAVMILSLALLILAALPWLVGGIAFVVLPINAQAGIDSGTLAGSPLAGYTADQITALVRGGAAVPIVLGVVYIVLAVLAFLGRNWARIVLTVLTAIFAVVLVLSLVLGILAGSDQLLIVALVAVPVVGVVLMYLRPSSAWFAEARRGL